ncbi:D-allose transport system permease protein AlsC [Symmachiella dynata]|uniref:ABC transporter permease n=1 Tax=Symmachiella dynata TaxID=2527995 RepID=UPI00118A135E|nr:ABC transporter permease [Symmachiella dynata]QDT47750.1 D-allose transport system permease protein AlsC [Symmachiella dynata]
MSPNDSNPGNFARWLQRYGNELGLLFAILVVVGITAGMDDSYRQKTSQNAAEILRQASLLGIFALGAATVIIAGGIDLSSGSVIAFSGAICTSIMISLAPVDDTGNPQTRELGAGILCAAVVGTLLVAVLIGSFHAWLITVIGLPPFIATLASLVGLRSLAQVLVRNVTDAATTQGQNTQIYVNDASFRSWGSRWWIPLVIFLVLSGLMWILMSKTVIGRHLYALGGNEEAAKLSGIRTDRLKWLAYCVGTVTAAIAGILYSSYVGMSNPATQGIGYELNAIAAAVVGGCSLSGGIGTIPGVMLGALFLRVVIDSVAKTVKTNPDEFQGLIVGALVVLAVAFNELRDAGALKKQFFPGGLGVVNIFILSLLGGVITAVMSSDHKLVIGGSTAVVILGVLAFKKFLEMRSRN